MNISFDNLKKFFDQIKEINLWKRIFNWHSIKSLSYDAYEEFKQISQKIEELNQQLVHRDLKINALEKANDGLSIKVEGIQKLESKIEKLEGDLNKCHDQKNGLQKQVTQFEQIEESRTLEYQKDVAALNAIRENLENDIKKLHDDRIDEQRKEFEDLKDTWKNHEENVENTIKNICINHMIEYVDKVPFKGNPDNILTPG